MKRFVAALLLLTTCTGCPAIMHELQPHRLWRLNYTDTPGRSDGAFLSVADPLEATDALQPPAPAEAHVGM